MQADLSSIVNYARRRAVEAVLAEVPPRYKSVYLRAVTGRASPRKAIEAFCRECTGWEQGEAERCLCTTCPLWSYRPGEKAERASSRP